jgi:Flp pilus assembly protein TadD
MGTNGLLVMSLINQMLRDLEKRSSTHDAPPTLHHNIQVKQPPVSKMRVLIWSSLATVSIGSTYWAYQYNKALTKTAPAIAADNIKEDLTPIAPYEKVLTAPNAVIDVTATTEQKPLKNTATQSISVDQPAAVQAPVPTAQPKPPSQPIPTASADQVAPEIVAAPPIKNRPIIPKAAQINQTTAKQQADLLYRQVESNFENYSAIYKLEQVLKLDPRHLKARLLLAKALHNQGQINKTAEFLDQSLALFPDNLQFINTRAQLFLQQRNPNGALKTLQRIELANSSNETYLSLLAATYQQLQSFSNAAKVYQKLVSVNPEKAENWLGLGLSQEKLGNLKLARDAYQQALSKETLKESVVSYIKQRLTELR